MRTTLNIVYAVLGIGLAVAGIVIAYGAVFQTNVEEMSAGLAVFYARFVLVALGAIVVSLGLLLTRPR